MKMSQYAVLSGITEVSVRRSLRLIVLAAAGCVAAGSPGAPKYGASSSDGLYRQFQDPPRTYTVRPFWFWNGLLDARESDGAIDLGLWTERGLAYFSGAATYEKEVHIPAPYVGRRLVLDCGKVGSAAEVWVNGESAGARVWTPFSFDISTLVRPGSNTVRISVANTMANERAVENHARQLPKIDLDGLLGPVTITAGETLPGRGGKDRR